MPITQANLHETPYQMMIELMPVGMVLLNEAGVVSFVNREARRILVEDCLGLSWRLVIQSVFSPKADDGHEISLIDGKKVHVSIAAIEEPQGQLVTLIDLTTSRTYEQHREQEARLSLIGQMTASLAHQIRTPLASARLYCDQLLTHANLTDKASTWLQKTITCHETIDNQIESLLLFVKGEQMVKTDVLWSRFVEKFLTRTESITEKCQIIVTLDKALHDVSFLINEEAMLGALMNLVENSLQANASKIHCDFSKSSDGVEITLSDNGVGMTEATKKQAIEAFYTTKARGTGLGLAVVKNVVEAHKGHIDLDSRFGEGCTITLHLKEN